MEGLSDLHKAVLKETAEDVLKVLQAGCDVNVLDAFGRTTLFYALARPPPCIETICMLLCHGIDIFIIDSEGNTALSYAYESRRPVPYGRDPLYDSVKILINYCDKTFLKSIHGVKVLWIAARIGSPAAVDLVRAGCELTLPKYIPHNETPIELSLAYKSAELFKLIISKLDLNTLVVSRADVTYKSSSPFTVRFTPFMVYYFERCNFPTQEFIECLYLLLNSSVAYDLVENCFNRSCIQHFHKHYFIHFMVNVFSYMQVSGVDRVRIIYSFLSLGMNVNFFEFNAVFYKYGFNDELEALLYGVNDYDTDYFSSYISFFFEFILGCETNYEQAIIHSMYANEIIQYNTRGDFNGCSMMRRSFHNIKNIYIFNLPRFFALSEYYITELRKSFGLLKPFKKEIRDVVDSIPTLPSSLLELSRNAYRMHVQKTYQFKKPYQFHDFINNLQIPKLCKDILRLKKPIYYKT